MATGLRGAGMCFRVSAARIHSSNSWMGGVGLEGSPHLCCGLGQVLGGLGGLGAPLTSSGSIIIAPFLLLPGWWRLGCDVAIG